MCCRQQGNKNFDCHCQVQWLYLFAAEYLFWIVWLICVFHTGL
jgi:hypothetical protein